MKRNSLFRLLSIIICCSTALAPVWCQQRFSPTLFGLDTASTGESRYEVLYRTHEAANAAGAEVDYTGIDTLRLQLPEGWKSIPLGSVTDFKGLVLYVENHSKHGALFSRSANTKAIELDKATIDRGDFSTIPELANGQILLILKDKHPWVAQRIGYGYPQYRSDIILIDNGRGLNRPIAPYNTDSTILNASYCRVQAPVVVSNLTMHRVDGSTQKTYCVSLHNLDNITLENIHITTPRSKMIADAAISIGNCTHVTLRDITVDGTYSGYGRTRDYGYAFSMNNVWNSTFDHVVADGNWGVFGTNNLSNTTLTHCDVNRFDIHCYGRDARLVGCILRQKQTQFSSMYGTVEFDSCLFADCIPVRVRSSYNAYTPFDIVMRHCTFEATLRHHALVNMMLLDTNLNRRPELQEKCWPNLTIDDLTVIAPVTVRHLYLYDPTGTRSECRKPVGHISTIQADGIRVVRPNGRKASPMVELTSYPFATQNELKVDIHYTEQ